jgi:Flp pilus assembly pilin Flp
MTQIEEAMEVQTALEARRARVKESEMRQGSMQRVATVGAGAGRSARQVLADVKGQGTTEYAILVGVLVVIAIVAIIAFRGKVQELWDAIVSGMNSL